MSDERNFRTYYYEKFGFHGVEEKKSIEILLKEHPLDVEKLRLFCLRYPIPTQYRIYLWKVILGILSANQDRHDFMIRQRTTQYQDLFHALQVLHRINDSTPLPEVFLRMYLIEEGMLPFEEQGMMTMPNNRIYLSLASVMCGLVEDQVDMYWITNRFYRLLITHKDTLLILPEKVDPCLKKEDTDLKLWSHIQKHQLLSSLPLSTWFQQCYAGILPETSVERVLDKVAGGSFIILVYVAVAMILTLRRPLLSIMAKEDMLTYLTKIHEDSGDIIVNKAIDLWQKYGHQKKSASPNFLE
ncbi:hypothetical protein CHS0354_021307 [Potamilus streckersoni]|uniref:TBC1 domain family member 7 n=1 Tax=Potamilus streckersoni TaxID=2493646 RepID=A0AAE0TK65_9BIVA|nr:hypothetical protein CHS0354_021307 [Potamilus streckersoni]